MLTILDDPLCECWGVVHGDYRSPNGAARHGECKNPPMFKVTQIRPPPGTRFPMVAYCGVHVRMFRRLPSHYRIEALEK